MSVLKEVGYNDLDTHKKLREVRSVVFLNIFVVHVALKFFSTFLRRLRKLIRELMI